MQPRTGPASPLPCSARRLPWWAAAERRAGRGIDGVVLSASDPSHEHTTEAQEYPDRPPVGGPHWPPQAGGVIGWLRCGVYTEPVPDEFAVHSLEHGAIWLTHRPGASDEQVAELTEIAAARPDYAVVSPYPGQEEPFAATAWGARLPVDDPSGSRLREFFDRYAAGPQGGEQGAGCANGTVPEAARAALAAANGGRANAARRGDRDGRRDRLARAVTAAGTGRAFAKAGRTGVAAKLSGRPVRPPARGSGPRRADTDVGSG